MDEGTFPSVLGPVGIEEVEERVYQELLRARNASPAEIAAWCLLPRERSIQILRALEVKGLASRLPGRVARFAPTPPEIALDTLILRRQEELNTVRLAAARFDKEFRSVGTRTSPNELVEILTGPAAGQRCLQAQRAAQEEVLVFDPYLPNDPMPEGPGSLERGLLERGVRCRAIYDKQILEEPGGAAYVSSCAAAGEEARITAVLPMQMLLVDRRMAILPLVVGVDGLDNSSLVLHHSSLLEAMVALWETYWEHARPLPMPGGAKRGARANGLEPGDEQLLALSAAGMTTSAIARQLGFGVSTVERKMRRIMDSLKADTRFQAGFLAAQSGLVKL